MTTEELKNFMAGIFSADTAGNESTESGENTDNAPTGEAGANGSSDAKEPDASTVSIDPEELRSIIRDEIAAVIKAQVDQKKTEQRAARAASVSTPPEENTRTADDILADRFLAQYNSKKEKE